MNRNLSRTGKNRAAFLTPSILPIYPRISHSISPRKTLVAALPLSNKRTRSISPSTGAPSEETTIPINTYDIPLPKGHLTALQIDTERSATAVIYSQTPEPDFKDAKVIVFGHGFSQRPRNYRTLLNTLAAQGYVVVAPRAWIFSVVWPWVKVETIGFFASPPAKLQTALLIDTARCVQMVRQAGASEVHVIGHSMGGAMTLCYGGWDNKIESMVLLAPAVGITSLTELNQYVSLDAKDGKEGMRKLATKLGNMPILVLHGTDDRIVSNNTMEEMYTALKRAVLMGFGSMVDGSHVGFQDQLDVKWGPIDLIDDVLMKVVNWIFFEFDKENSLQLEAAKAILGVWLEKKGRGDVVKRLEDLKEKMKVEYQWEGLLGN